MTKRLIYIIGKLVSRIPLSVGRFSGKLLGIALSMIPMKRTRVARENIQKAFDGSMEKAEMNKIYRKVILHFGQLLFEIPHIIELNQGNLDKYVYFKNEENLIKAIEKGRGVFLLTGHFGNWELMSAAISLRFGSLSIVARPFDFQPLDRLMNSLRTSFGTELIPKQRAMRKLMRAIRQNRMVGILLDQNVDWYDGVFINFLGRSACTNKGLALMALKTGAPVIPVFSVRQKDGRYRIVFENEVRLKRSGDKTKDVEENTALFTGVIEDYIRQYPDHWFWFHMRWKTRPYWRLPDDFYQSKDAALPSPHRGVKRT
ncbi:MAG: lysophospholipid acyltransferase family protein [Deltaproteobacteria bacterium]|nr:lysophospholipid acyltransferase family protein [Deltaproteobacteria bacterium]